MKGGTMMKRMVAVAVAMTALWSLTAPAADKEAARLPGLAELKASAEKGNPVAQNNVGAKFATGDGVAQDYRQAATWYEKAASAGYAVAQHNLGGLYEHGLGVDKDPAAAAVWYALAAEQGDGWAEVSLAHLHAKGLLVQNDLATAYRWLVVASASDDKEVKAAAAELTREVASKLSPAARAEAETMARAWRPNH
jgi:uncharacterized protein